MDLMLTGDQEDEMTQLVMAVQEKGQKELEAIIEEAESIEEGNGGAIREVWDQDLSIHKKFYEDQLKNSTFTKCNYLS